MKAPINTASDTATPAPPVLSPALAQNALTFLGRARIDGFLVRETPALMEVLGALEAIAVSAGPVKS